uniref:Uncharacterized protein n=1 Tax=Helianthus annuus TaxID=4232 RepID=A0A251SG17_HELAN
MSIKHLDPYCHKYKSIGDHYQVYETFEHNIYQTSITVCTRNRFYQHPFTHKHPLNSLCLLHHLAGTSSSSPHYRSFAGEEPNVAGVLRPNSTRLTMFVKFVRTEFNSRLYHNH